MQSTNLEEIKAALWGQAFGLGTQVGCPMGRVVAIRRRQGKLQAMVRGWGIRWYPVERVIIEDWLTKPAMQHRSSWKHRLHLMQRSRHNERASCLPALRNWREL